MADRVIRRCHLDLSPLQPGSGLRLHFTTPKPLSLNPESLRQRLVRAASWSLLGYGLSQVIRLGSNLVLTRLLAPDLFGVMAVGYMVIVGLNMFSDIGLGPSIVQNPRGEEPRFLNVCWVVQILRGSIITLVGLGIALALHLVSEGRTTGGATSVYTDPRLPGVVAGLSLVGLVGGLESTRVWLARRRMVLGRLTQIELASSITATVVTLLWAAWSHSVWALVFGGVVGAMVKTALTHLALPGPGNRPEWEPQAFNGIFAFGKWAFLSSILSFLIASGDRILLGGFLDATTMGFYAIAFLLVNSLQAAVGKVEAYAVLPALAEVVRDNPAKLKRTIYRVRLPVDVVCLLSSGALFILGDLVVRFLYDSRYAPAGWMMSILALTLIGTRLDMFDQCVLSLGRPKLLSGLSTVRLAALYSLVPFGYLFFGLKGAIWAVACSSLVSAAAVLSLQRKLRLLSIKRELLALPLFATGLLIGWVVRVALS
jgi:O-antigen/teichoic acid export membrane protein